MRQKLLSHRWVGEKMEAYVEEKCTTLEHLVPRVVFETAAGINLCIAAKIMVNIVHSVLLTCVQQQIVNYMQILINLMHVV